MQLYEYIMEAGFATLKQLLILLGPVLLLAFFMHFLALLNEKLSYKVFGRKAYLYLFAWLGTSVHELGHAFFALLFGHKITDIQLFSPKGEGGSLGYVSHSYNKRNLFQRIGNFFIGIGPILFGTLLLFVLLFFLFRFQWEQLNTITFTKSAFSNYDSFIVFCKQILIGFKLFLKQIFLSQHSQWWKIAVLIYILFSVGSSITLSKSDVSGAGSGFVVFVLTLFVFNLSTLWIGDFTLKFFTFCNQYLSGFYYLMLFSMLISLVFIVLLVLLNAIKNVFK